ncbi:hypothetical protein [Achromobacter sp. NFACC18-2]|uniref:hypothetical protein n=1 Tax=Achromobacter sp. NFACC18-2 TaxID=1564112 RepID=UPI0008C400FF|nr:hypothetical protein [Achromobacter sp. NFACC18-2]SEK03528.1 hypothetical protein SAMN03159494_04533 [Achromobacter sp. NFACC18-2]
MSGPKVVVLVTREQMRATADGLLKRLDQAIASWAAEGQRCGMLSDEEIAATRRRGVSLAALMETDDLVRLLEQVPDEIAFLKADVAKRQQAAADKAEQAARRERHSRHGAATALRALKTKGTAIPAELGESLEAMRAGRTQDNAETVLAQAFSLLAPAAPTALSAAQEALAEGLRSFSDTTMDVQAWKAANAALDRDPVITRLDRHIGEAAVHLGQAEAAEFSARLLALDQEANGARGRLLMDSLTLDLAGAIETACKRRAAREALQELGAELGAYSDADAAAFAERASQLGADASITVMETLVESGQALVAQAQQQHAAEARRRAVLGGLAKLGYEVHDGMETAWANDGRVVIKKPSVPGYGVEVGGQAARMQVRVVTTDPHRDVSRDSEVESMWCGEFGQLQDLLASRGDELLIERALGVGAVPLKLVSGAQQTEHGTTQIRSLK